MSLLQDVIQSFFPPKGKKSVPGTPKIENPLCLPIPPLGLGAGNEARTRDPDLGKVVLYQLSYSRVHIKRMRRHYTNIFVQCKYKIVKITRLFIYSTI